MNIGVLVVVQDAATASCGLLNAGYFAGYWWRRNGSPGRRLGALALSFVGAATVMEAAFSQGLFWSGGDVSSSMWALLRLPLLVATAVVSAIVLRRVVG